LSRKICPDPSFLVCYHQESGWSVGHLPELLPSDSFADGAPC
jgi:hypothetical protein